MQEFIQNFHFLRPWCLLLLLLPVLAYFLYYSKLNTSSSWEKVCDKNLLNFLLVRGSSLQRKIIFYICGIGFFFAVISASGPSWIKKEVEGVSKSIPIMIVLNLSSDMMEKDISPDRLTRAKYAISDLLSGINQAQKGLIVYTSEPFLITPVTEDSQIINNLLPNINFDIMPENGDRLDLALRFAQETLARGGWKNGRIIVFSADVGQNFAKALQSAQDISSSGYIIDAVNVSVQNNEKLKEIAEKGRGYFVNIKNINTISANINNNISTELKKSNNKITQWLDYGYYLLPIPLLCCLYLFRRGVLIIVFLIMLGNEAYAGFFLNNNQEGLIAFNNKDYKAATEKFSDNNWQGASNYRLGQYEEAYKYFSNYKDETAIYNQGNALAKMGKIEDAIKKYEEVLKNNPNHEDAKFNLEYLQQQQQNQSSSSSNNDENNNQQNQDKQQAASPQDSEQEQNQDKQQQGQSDSDKEQQNDSNSQNSDDESNKDNEKTTSKQQEQNQATNPKDELNEAKENKSNTLQNNEGSNTYDEEVQARELQYREIPEDAGGLLRAFIAKEYAKNRYAKDR